MRRRRVLLGILLASASCLAPNATTAQPPGPLNQLDLPPRAHLPGFPPACSSAEGTTAG